MKVNTVHIDRFKKAVGLKTEATQELYYIVVDKFLQFSGLDTSRDSVINYLSTISKNSRVTEYYAIKFFCKSAGLPFEVTRSDIAPTGIEVVRPMLTIEEAKKLIKTVPKYFGTVEVGYLVLSTVYGLRRSEIYYTEAEHIDIDNRIFTTTVKKHLERTVRRPHVIPEQVAAHMYELKEGLENIKSKPSINMLNFMFDTMCHKSGVELRPRLGFHSIRRLLNTRLRIAGLSEEIISSFIRWVPREKSMSRHYFIEDIDTVREIDNNVFKVHPLLKYWSEDTTSTVEEGGTEDTALQFIEDTVKEKLVEVE